MYVFGWRQNRLCRSGVHSRKRTTSNTATSYTHSVMPMLPTLSRAPLLRCTESSLSTARNPLSTMARVRRRCCGIWHRQAQINGHKRLLLHVGVRLTLHWCTVYDDSPIEKQTKTTNISMNHELEKTENAEPFNDCCSQAQQDLRVMSSFLSYFTLLSQVVSPFMNLLYLTSSRIAKSIFCSYLFIKVIQSRGMI